VWVALASLFCCAALRAATGAEFKTSVSQTMVSSYVFRGQLLGGASIQPSIDLQFGQSSLGLWANVPVNNRVKDTADPEVDFSVSHRFIFNADADLSVGTTAYLFPRADPVQGNHRVTWEPSLSVSYTFRGVRLSPRVFWDLTLRGVTYELGAAYALPFPSIGWELDFSAVAGRYDLRSVEKDAPIRVRSWGDYWLLGVSSPVQVSPRSKFIVSWFLSAGRDAYRKRGFTPKVINPTAVRRGVFSASYLYSF
jgi:hypothetical protein